MFSKKHILILFLFLIVMLCAISQISAADLNSTDDEMAIDDEITLNETNSKTFSDLDYAINGNSKNDIYLNDDFKFSSSVDSGFEQGINVTRPVTIYGNNHVIDADNKARIFLASDKKIVFRDITFTNGYVRYDGEHINGGAIYGDFTCINCTFVSNSAVNAGAVHGGTVINCTFKDNYAYYWGGAIYFGSVYNCTFINNRADYGGALWYCFSCENSIFIDNFASLTGGAVNTAPVKNCTFIRNYAKYGGALYMKGVYSIYECLDSSFVNNSAEQGGSIYYDVDVDDNSASRFTAMNCNFTNNRAKDGGALYNVNSFDSRFDNNNASENGGALYKGMAKNSIFVNNSAEYGGAMYNGISVENTFENNTANVNGNDAVNTAFKLDSKISVSDVSTVYNVAKSMVITLMDSKDNALSEKTINVKINGKTHSKVTDGNGQVIVSSYNRAPKQYHVTIIFDGDEGFLKTDAAAKITVAKATPKITASKKTFKLKTKTKKYTITLKNNKNKAIKKAKVTLKVKGKTYTAKTNSKGKATFKITKLTKKGTFKATIKYAGGKFYKAKSATAKITVKK